MQTIWKISDKQLHWTINYLGVEDDPAFIARALKIFLFIEHTMFIATNSPPLGATQRNYSFTLSDKLD